MTLQQFEQCINKGQDYFPNVDFSNVDFTNESLRCLNFENANFEGAIFNNSNLSYSNFSGANFKGASFKNTNAHNANFIDSYLGEHLITKLATEWNRTTIFYKTETDILVRCGCFLGFLQEFKERVEQLRSLRKNMYQIMIKEIELM